MSEVVPPISARNPPAVLNVRAVWFRRFLRIFLPLALLSSAVVAWLFYSNSQSEERNIQRIEAQTVDSSRKFILEELRGIVSDLLIIAFQCEAYHPASGEGPDLIHPQSEPATVRQNQGAF